MCEQRNKSQDSKFLPKKIHSKNMSGVYFVNKVILSMKEIFNLFTYLSSHLNCWQQK